MWNKIVVVVSAVNDGCSFERGNNPGCLKCDSIFKLPFSAFLWHNWFLPLIKSG